MSTNLLLHTGHLKVLIGNSQVSLHLLQSLGSDGIDTQLLLTLSQSQPELAPGRVTRSLTEESRHLFAAVAGGEGGLVRVVRGSHFDSVVKVETRV